MAKLLNVAIILVVNLLTNGRTTAATWCVARTDAAEDALQKGLDYACGAGADCASIQDTGPCFLPNTVQAHASYAFNSYYMHASMDPSSCNFYGTATVAKTDPSYGSCVYPASPAPSATVGTGGGLVAPILGATPAPPQNFTSTDGSIGTLTPTDIAANTPSSKAYSEMSSSRLLFMGMMFVVFVFMFKPMDVLVA